MRYLEKRSIFAPSSRYPVNTAFPTVNPRSPDAAISPCTGCQTSVFFSVGGPNDSLIACGPVMNSPGPENICASGAAYRPNATPVPDFVASFENSTSADRIASSGALLGGIGTFGSAADAAACGTVSAGGGVP